MAAEHHYVLIVELRDRVKPVRFPGLVRRDHPHRFASITEALTGKQQVEVAAIYPSQQDVDIVGVI